MKPGRLKQKQLQEVALVRIPPAKHSEALYTSSVLTESFYHMQGKKSPHVTPEDVIKELNCANVEFVLIGAHGIGDWSREPRATRDVDVLIAAKHHMKATKAIRRAYPELVVQDLPVVTRFSDPPDGAVLIDLMKPIDPMYKAVFENTIQVAESHRIPDLEMALTTKYAAMISPQRALDKKYIDAADFIRIVRYNHEDLDLNKLNNLGETVFVGGGKELLKFVDDVLAGRRLEI